MNNDTTLDECLDDIFLGTRQYKLLTLPGFEDDVECVLCQIVTGKSALGEERRQGCSGGATIKEVFLRAQHEFHNSPGKPPLNIAKEVYEALQYFVQHLEGNEFAFLRDITPEQILRHFMYDHTGQNTPKTKEKVEKVLLSMLSVGLKSCCECQDNGQVRLAKEETQLILSIIDRLLKIK